MAAKRKGRASQPLYYAARSSGTDGPRCGTGAVDWRAVLRPPRSPPLAQGWERRDAARGTRGQTSGQEEIPRLGEPRFNNRAIHTST